jgi:hypothetical protein
MPEHAAVAMKVVFGLIGIITIVIAYLMGVKKKLNLVAGYKPEKTKDPEGLAKFMGFWTFIVGLILILYPWIKGVQSTNPPLWSAYFIIPIVVIIVIMLVGCSRYEHKAK